MSVIRIVLGWLVRSRVKLPGGGCTPPGSASLAHILQAAIIRPRSVVPA